MIIRAKCKRCKDVIELPLNKNNMKQCFCGEIYIMTSNGNFWGNSLRPDRLEWLEEVIENYLNTL